MARSIPRVFAASLSARSPGREVRHDNEPFPGLAARGLTHSLGEALGECGSLTVLAGPPPVLYFTSLGEVLGELSSSPYFTRLGEVLGAGGEVRHVAQRRDVVRVDLPVRGVTLG